MSAGAPEVSGHLHGAKWIDHGDVEEPADGECPAPDESLNNKFEGSTPGADMGIFFSENHLLTFHS